MGLPCPFPEASSFFQGISSPFLGDPLEAVSPLLCCDFSYYALLFNASLMPCKCFVDTFELATALTATASAPSTAGLCECRGGQR